MSYGDHLEAAVAAVARAHAALRDPPSEPGQRLAAARARAGLYRSLEHHVVILGAVRPADLPPADHVPLRLEWHVTQHRPATNLAISLRHAPAGTTVADATLRATATAIAAVPVALHQARQALQAAGDILISNTGPVTDPLQRPQPHTPEGVALLAGQGRSDNLAAIARLAAAAVDMDVRLARWMWPEDAPASLRPLLTAAENDAWRTKSGSLRSSATIVASRGNRARATTLDLIPAPPIDNLHRWAAIGNLAHCVDAVDAARSWLIRHGEDLTVRQLAAAATAMLAMTHHIGHIHTSIGPADTAAIDTHVVAAAGWWRTAARTARELRSPAFRHTDHTTLTVALTSTARWLHTQLRPDGTWRDPPPWTPDPAAAGQWRETATKILARMPDLADLLHGAIIRSQARGSVLAPTRELTNTGHLIQIIKWDKAPAVHHAYQRLCAALTNAGRATRELAAITGTPLRPGITDGTTRNRGNAARLAEQWYPTAGLSEPSSPTKPPHRRPETGTPRTRRAPRLS